MKTLSDKRFIALVAAAVLSGGVTALADDGKYDDHSDHERARHALEKGEVRPLADILDSVGGDLGGKLVGVDFEREDGRYVYEFKVITPSGRLREVYVDANTAQILKSEDE
ncbi:peptidase M4 [Stappia sp. GBMRC 2046]|uniref:Peptidase M4 n=1 Tax=Stappia sediminis TaxID=2692190 RepID=A0A7X3LR79_9HYPH|nr:PepSY domain-containing protein [Stappia sediminis]MXN63622.1 peptidase M4 [Stappia sediminis]